MNHARQDYLDSIHEADTTLLQEITRCRSIVYDEHLACARMEIELSNMGLDVQVQELAPYRYNVIARLPRNTQGTRAPTLHFNGHLDTNPICQGSANDVPEAWNGWSVDPLGGTIQLDPISGEDCVYGIGVSNMKASDAAYVETVRGLVNNPTIKRYGDVLLSFVVGELQNGLGTHTMLTDAGTRELARHDYFIVGEPTSLALFTRHSAAMTLQGAIHGESRHISKQEEAIDAGAALGATTANLRKNGTAMLRENTKYPELCALAVGSEQSGLGPDFSTARAGQIPDHAQFLASARYGPDLTRAQVQSILRHAIELNRGPTIDRQADVQLNTVEAADQLLMPPFSSPDCSRIARLARQSLEEIGLPAMQNPTDNPARLYGSDCTHLRRLGRGDALKRRPQGIMWGAGGRFNTQADERVQLSEWQHCIDAYGRVLFDLTCTKPNK